MRRLRVGWPLDAGSPDGGGGCAADPGAAVDAVEVGRKEGGEEIFCAGHNEPSQSGAIDAEIKFATLRAGFRSCSTRLVRNELEAL